MADVELNLKGLQDLRKMLKESAMKARIGTFDIRNASIGALYEVGSSRTPQRSFLLVPLEEQFAKTMEASGKFDQNLLDEMVEHKSIEPLIHALGETAKEVVHGAFETSGYGKWPPTRKKTGKTLIASGRLRDSIEVKYEGKGN